MGADIEWRRRLGGRRIAHVFRAGLGVCPWGGAVGSPLVVETKLSDSGLPFGNVCTFCKSLAAVFAAQPEGATK